MDAEALTKTISLGNYKNEGAVSLEKFHAWTEKPLSGAKFTLYQYSVNSEGTGEWTPVSGKTNVTAANGKLTFSDLPIYDEEKSEIRYRISETEAPSGFDLDENHFEFTLSLDGTVTQAEKYDAEV